MSRALALALVCAACTASAPSRAEQPTRWIEPPLFDPKAFRIETVLCDVPLGVAKTFGVETSAHGPLIGVRVDETNEYARLDASPELEIRPLERPSVIVEPRGTARVPARSDASAPAASDALDIDVRASTSYDFAPVDLEITIAWRDGNEVIGRVKGSAPQPKDHWIAITCAPKTGQEGPAILGFVRAVPIFDDASSFATLDPGEGVDSASGRLSNTGAAAIRYAVDGQRRPVVIELGRDGRAKWEGDRHSLSVSGGAEAEFVCAGRANALTATMSGGSIVFLGFENRCTNVANGSADTIFISRPGADANGRTNWLGLGGEPARVEGPWSYYP